VYPTYLVLLVSENIAVSDQMPGEADPLASRWKKPTLSFKLMLTHKEILPNVSP